MDFMMNVALNLPGALIDRVEGVSEHVALAPSLHNTAETVLSAFYATVSPQVRAFEPSASAKNLPQQ